ncbi:MAG: pyruvate, phosphate dikinase [bacterium]
MSAAESKEDQYLFFFGGGDAEGSAELAHLLGGKGSNLNEMSRIGVEVPPGFTISTEVCRQYYDNDRQYPEGLREEVDEYLGRVEELMDKDFGDSEDPLLFSVRSGAPVSMPGMMDTVLNLGLNDETVKGLEKQSNDARFAYDSYRRFVQMYGNVVKGIENDVFEELIEEKKEETGAESDTDLTAEDWEDLVGQFKKVFKEKTGEDFPEDPIDQLWGGITAVFESWNNERAIKWREINDLPHDVGTAVNVQTMVYGNMGADCATGVAFTRDPATGEKEAVGEYLPNAQGEDVVSGVRTPRPINEYERENSGKTDMPTLEEEMPEAYDELTEVFDKLEEHYQEMQDIEFTVQNDDLYILQTRTGKRTAAAMVKIAHDFAEEGIISRKKALDRVEADRLDQLLHPMISGEAKENNDAIAVGLGASPGAACGQIVFEADLAEDWVENGKDVILVRHETSPDDIGGMNVAEGILTSRGGGTSHAAVVARGMGKPCVAGCGALEIDYDNKQFIVGGETYEEGDWLTLDGATGEVFSGQLEMEEAKMTGEFETVMGWADKFRELGVRTNADTPEDAQFARDFGAEGIGLCRTEHMFFDEDRINHVREMILSAPDVQQLRLEKERLVDELETAKESQEEEIKQELAEVESELEDVLPPYEQALEQLQPMQKEDFVGIFEAMEGLPVTVRLLDPPLHEFLPHGDAEKERLAESLDISVEEIDQLISNLTEANPMLGHRGCRMGISYPEVYEMQTRAIMEAAVDVSSSGAEVQPEIMIPLVGAPKELSILRERVDEVCQEVLRDSSVTIDYKIGTMIELPRAALLADQIAEDAEFFSFGTNDLTQTTYGLSRDDSAMFMEHYQHEGIFDNDPFAVLDQDGVGELIETAVERGRRTRSALKVGICGEHGGEPSSVKFCHGADLDYVSCSPYRVPIARLAAAQAAVDVEEDLTSY